MIVVLFIALIAVMLLRAFINNRTVRTWLFITATAIAAIVCLLLLAPLGI